MMKFPTILQDERLNAKLETDGFVVTSFLTKNEVEELLALYNQLGNLPDRFYSSTHIPDHEVQLSVKKKVDSIVERAKNEIIHNQAATLGVALLNKPIGDGGILPLHQDWNIVDESQNRSFNIWIPLVNVDEQNGAVKALAGSHLIKSSFRGPNLELELQDISKEVLPKLKAIPMNAGDALIHDHALWHASGPNNSNSSRQALVIGCTMEGVQLKFYYQEERGLAEYDANVEFYQFGEAINGPGNLQLSKMVDHEVNQITMEEFNLDFLGISPQKKSWFAGLMEVFKK